MGGSTAVKIAMEPVAMKKSISLLHCISILCSVTGNISVFIAPAAILQATGSIGLSLVMWTVGGAINLALALCFTELATMFPKAGGPYAYVTSVFGDVPGFMLVWGYILLVAAPIWALIANLAALYLVQTVNMGCEPSDGAVKLLAAVFILLFVSINCVYVKFVTLVQSALTLTKILALLLIIICGLYKLTEDDGRENLLSLWDGTVQDPSLIAMSFFYSIFTYGGWQVLVNLMEEVKDPGRDLPKAVYISFLIITSQFLLVNFAYYIVLNPQELLRSDTVAITFFEQFYPPLTAVISILVAVTAIGVLNASILGHSRMLFAAARNGHAPVIFSMIQIKYLTPWPAIIAITCLSFVMLLTGSVFVMMKYISLFSLLLSLSVIITLLYLRWAQPTRHRPYKTQLFVPVSQLVLLVAVLILAVYHDPVSLGQALGILAAGLPVYLVGVRWRGKPRNFTAFINVTTAHLQKALVLQKSS